MSTSVRELYEVWAADSELRDELGRSLGPRGADWLFEVFAGLGLRPGELVLDEGGEWDLAEDQPRLARLRRHETELYGRFGSSAVAAVAGGIMVYAWERRA